MKQLGLIGFFGVLVAACTEVPLSDVDIGNAGDETVRPQTRPAAAAPPVGARTAEQFDTTTQLQRSEAASSASSGARLLGTTIASLGTPSEAGFWLKTPLVTSEQSGRVVYAATGKSVRLTLIPIDGPATAGSRMSLAALRVIDAPLAGLPQLQVYAVPEG